MLNPEYDQIMPGDFVEVADGYNEDGSPRPWVKRQVITVIGRRDGLKVTGIVYAIPYRSARKILS